MRTGEAGSTVVHALHRKGHLDLFNKFAHHGSMLELLLRYAFPVMLT